MGCRKGVKTERKSRGVDTGTVAKQGQGRRFIDGDPARDSVGKIPAKNRGVLGKVFCRVPVESAVGLFQFKRGVPVDQGGAWFDPGFEKRVNEFVIKAKSDGVHRTLAAGLDTGPEEAETVCVNSQVLPPNSTRPGHPR